MADNITPRGFVVGTKRADEPAEANLVVTKLWEQYLARRLVIDSFEFRDSVLREVMKAFGTLNFRDWYFNQNTSVFVNDMHKRFLVDTLNYITTGEREFELATWDSLLSKEQVPTPVDRHELNEAEAVFFGISTSSGIRDTNKDNIELPYIIYQWCNKDNGVIDLLYTAHILFGRPNKEPAETAVIVVSD